MRVLGMLQVVERDLVRVRGRGRGRGRVKVRVRVREVVERYQLCAPHVTWEI